MDNLCDLMKDEEIVKLFIRHDEMSITAIAEKYGCKLTSLAKRITSDDFIAEECVNDTYMAAWNGIRSPELSKYLYPYLARITRHIALNRYEKEHAQKRGGTYVELCVELDQCVASNDRTENVVDDIVLKDSLNSFISALDEEKRNVFLRRYWFFDEITDISERLGYSESKVKSMLLRIRSKLRDHLEQDGITGYTGFGYKECRKAS